MSSPVLSARDLVVVRRSRRSRFELHVPALDLYAGEALAILGPNGAGKTTLLRALASLEPLAGGRIVRAAAGPVTMAFQRPIPFDGSVEHNVRTALLSSRLSRTERRERVAQALGRFGIAQLAKRRAAQLSGGELRRLALARAFALQPAVLLLDEPFDDLDAAAQEALSIDLRRAIDQTGVALAVVTHDLRRAALISDRIAALIGGRIQQLDERATVLARPATLAVARLVGMSNLIRGTVRERRPDGQVRVEVDRDHHLDVESQHPPGTQVWVGLRPEHLKIDVGRGEGAAIGKGIVRQLVSDGMLTRLTLEWAGLELRTHLVAGRGLARSLAIGDSVTLAVRPGDLHLIAAAPEP
ncbi:MAG: ABC transporter ATP-binding protein [Myxococcota bacterium]